MITQKNSGEAAEGFHNFTVLYLEEGEFKRERAEGTFASPGTSELQMSTSFPLQPKQVVYWVDMKNKDELQFAMVKWSEKKGGIYKVGLSLL